MRRRIWWINGLLALLLVSALVGGYFWLFHSSATATTGRTVAVQSGSVSETVTATGTVQTSGTVTLSFAQAGTVDSVDVAAGDTVSKGQRLVALDGTSARQSLDAAQQTYVQSVSSAKQSTLSLSSARQTLADAQRTAQLNRTGYEQGVADARSALAKARATWSTSCLDPNGTCPSTDAWGQLRSAEGDVTSAKTAYAQAVENATNDATTQAMNVNQASQNLAVARAKAASDCSTYGSSSSQCSTGNESVITKQQQYDTAVNNQRVAAAQQQQNLVNADARITSANVALKKLQASLAKQAGDSVDSAQKSVTSAQQSLRKGEAADQQSITRAQESLTSLEAGAAAVDTGTSLLSSSAASTLAARDAIATAQRNLDATVIKAPVSGTIGAVSVSAGDIAAGGATVVTLIPSAGYEVVASFSESDALKVKVGQKATVTFDALTGTTATGTVTSVDILPTTGGNVTTYGATISLTDAPTGLKDGMTASVVVTVDEASGVLWIPSSALTTAGGVSTVTVRRNGVDSVVQVTTGLAGDSGTAITSGLAAGDQVVIDTSTTSGSFPGFPGGGIPGGLTGGLPAGGPPARVGG